MLLNPLSRIRAIRKEAVNALIPMVVAAIVVPIFVAAVPAARDLASHFLPAGAERLLVIATLSACIAEIIRCHWLKFRLTIQLKQAQPQTDIEHKEASGDST